ncbi:MAG: potassium channel family protein [Muribaculaceae bacterium]|nr:potassium channel family protein [Muribaculaceae bacterium]
MSALHHLSNRIRHFFHVVSNVRPIVWICLYVALTPVFALIYQALPDGQFRIPDGAGTDYGSWLYYSIVTITTLGFGDYTPAHGLAQSVTAVEVMCGLIILGFFLNAVGSMKSEIDVESEVEKQRRLNQETQRQNLLRNIPATLHNLNIFLSYCYAVTTPAAKRADEQRYNPDFSFSDMADMFRPSGLPDDNTKLPAVQRLLKSAERTSLLLDSLQNRVDMLQWPELLENCFGFVADCEMFTSADRFLLHPKPEAEQTVAEKLKTFTGSPDDAPAELQPEAELYHFIKKTASRALTLETLLSEIASAKPE